MFFFFFFFFFLCVLLLLFYFFYTVNTYSYISIFGVELLTESQYDDWNTADMP